MHHVPFLVIRDKRATLNTPPLRNPLYDSQVVKVAEISSSVQRAVYL